jgi:hypothetical protein
LILPVGEDREDEFENESFFGRDGMDFLWEEAGGAAEGGFGSSPLERPCAAHSCANPQLELFRVSFIAI